MPFLQRIPGHFGSFLRLYLSRFVVLISCRIYIYTDNACITTIPNNYLLPVNLPSLDVMLLTFAHIRAMFEHTHAQGCRAAAWLHSRIFNQIPVGIGNEENYKKNPFDLKDSVKSA